MTDSLDGQTPPVLGADGLAVVADKRRLRVLNKITAFTIRYNTRATRFARKYDARAEHARYVAPHQHEQTHTNAPT
ncbi:hypothetical protein GCM10011583_66310 [Streptomyces camponoticapitis]|uniref:Transposase n=1 Tax=Streptomyces camponoticapitis TaxID=1616125 RepID=A0ABQ2ET31_9ACTN|nr:hypothetical protein [Streptomyces camponoticapitis]GGK25008.1 hypothetical protein GCM10011583_66310 [Streptomyces camponoticapitis]